MVTFYFDLAHHIAAASFITVLGMGYWAPRWAARHIVARQVDRWQRGLTETVQKLMPGYEPTSVIALRSCAEDLKQQPAEAVKRLAEGRWAIPPQVPDAVEQYRRWLIIITEGYVSLAVPWRRRLRLNKALAEFRLNEAINELSEARPNTSQTVRAPSMSASETPGTEPAAPPVVLPRTSEGADISVGGSVKSARR